MSIEISKCIVCDSDSFIPATEFHIDLIKCTKCGLVFYKNIADKAEEYTYDDKYFEGKYYNYQADKPVTQRNFANRLKIIRKFLKQGKLLEIGCAYGFFLELANDDFEVHGIDIAEVGIKYARDVLGLLNVDYGGYLEKVYPENFFDVVCMFDTIEHLKEPHLFLAKAARELKKDGLICLTTGDISSWMAKKRKRKWRLISPPGHQVYFSYYTLNLLLEKSGFEIAHKSYPGYYRSLGMMMYLTIFNNKPSIVKNPIFKLIHKIPIYLNLFDIMFIIARKK